MASRKEYEMLFRLNAQLGGSYNGAFKAAQGAVVTLQNELMALSKTQADISAYQKQQVAIEANQQKLERLRQQYENIQREISETGEFSSALENRLLSKQLQIERTTGAIETQILKLEHMGDALRQAGIDTSNLTEESARLSNQMDDLIERQEAAADEAHHFGNTASSAFMTAGKAMAAAGIAVAIKEIYEAYAQCVEAAILFESAMTGVAKTTDMTEAELAAMSKEIKLLSTDIPVVTEELAGIGEVAGQLGIAKGNLLDFTEVMSMLSTATTMTAEEGATLLAQFANITRMDPAYYSNLASAIVDLGNNYATTEQKITEMAQGIAAGGALAGMSEADMVALSAAVTSLGMETEAGSTSMSGLISKLMTAVETGETLTDFASIANMTADEFKKAWGEDAVSALQAFVVGLNDTERNGKSATVALTELGITETRMKRMILSLSTSGDLLNRTLATANQAWNENAALINEAEKRYATTQSQLIMMQNAYNNLKIAIGDDFTPELRKLYALATDVLKATTEFVEENPELVKAVTAFIGVIGLAAGGLAAYVAIVKVAIPLNALLTASIPGLNVIMAVVGGIALVSAGIAALTEAVNSAKDETDDLTVASRNQHRELQELNAEYMNAQGQYEENSEEILELRYEIDELTAAYEANKQTLEEFIAENDALIKAQDEVIASYSDSTAAISQEEEGALALSHKLEELSRKTQLTTVEQEQMKALVDALNESIPDLALSYDEATESLNMSTDALKNMIKAQAEQERKAETYRKWVELEKKELALKEQLKEAEENLLLLRKELEESGIHSSSWFFTDYDEYEDEAERLREAYAENQAALADMAAQAEEYAAAQEAAAKGQAISTIIGEVRELENAYQEAYDAALESLSGQYALWDQAAEIVSTSAGEINAALESQANYWQEYNTNLANLADRSEQIEGLAEMISIFADGSPDSVNAIAGMASATDEQIASMVANWKAVQEEQKKVAGTLAELETDFAASVELMQSEMETAIQGMELSEEAAQSGRNTIQSFIDGASGKLPAVQAAYESIAKAAIAAIDAQLEIKSPSKVFELRGEYAMGGFIGGVTAMETEIAAAMQEAAKVGAQAFNAEEIPASSMMPYYVGHYTDVSAEMSSSKGGGDIVLTVSPVYNISGVNDAPGIEAVLHDATESLRDYILDVIEEAGIDSARRAYA